MQVAHVDWAVRVQRCKRVIPVSNDTDPFALLLHFESMVILPRPGTAGDSFIHSKIYIVPLQGNYSEALPTPVRTKGRFSKLPRNVSVHNLGKRPAPEGDHSKP